MKDSILQLMYEAIVRCCANFGLVSTIAFPELLESSEWDGLRWAAARLSYLKELDPIEIRKRMEIVVETVASHLPKDPCPMSFLRLAQGMGAFEEIYARKYPDCLGNPQRLRSRILSSQTISEEFDHTAVWKEMRRDRDRGR